MGHWLLVHGVRVCALVDCPGGCLVCDGVHNCRLRYRCDVLTAPAVTETKPRAPDPAGGGRSLCMSAGCPQTQW